MISETLTSAVPATRDQLFRRAIAVVLGAFLVAVSAKVEIPLGFSPVPVTMQGFAVVLVGLVLGSRLGAAALITYLTAGIVGLPVFAVATFGFTGGYLLAFPLGAFVAGLIAQRATKIITPVRFLLGALAGMAVVHLGGWAWLSIVTSNPGMAFKMGVAPFVLIDMMKVVLATGVALLIGGRVRRAL